MANGKLNNYPKEFPGGCLSGYPQSNLDYVQSLKEMHQARILFANFPVNSTILTKEHEIALRQLVKLLQNNLFASIIQIEGRASQTGPEKNNQKLSIGRAKEVANYFQRMGVRNEQIGPINAYGSTAPLISMPGQEVDINRSVLVYYHLPMHIAVKKDKKPIPKKTGNNMWAIQLTLSGSAGHVGIGGAFALGRLKDQISGKIWQGNFIGGGLGAGLQTPGGSPSWSNWSYFKTDANYTIEDFDNTLARLTMAGAGFFVGYCGAWISFPMLGANHIDVGGWNLGSVGADASSNVGTWNVIGI